MLGSGAFVAIVMSFCIGGNDSANSWGSTVGSGAIPLRRALLLGGVGEWLGATLLGAGVSNTIQKGVSHPDDPQCWACGYCDSRMSVYALGMLAALIGASVFLFAATFCKMPVSTTHAIVGGVVGMTLVGTADSPAFPCLSWGPWPHGLGSIIASWVISPLLSGLIAMLILLATDRLCVRSQRPVRNALIGLPLLYGLTTLTMVLLTLVKSRPTKHWPSSAVLGTALGLSLLTGLVVQLLVVPRVRASLQTHFPPEALRGDGMSAAVTAVPSAVPAQPAELSVVGAAGLDSIVAPVAVVEDVSSSRGVELGGVRVRGVGCDADAGDSSGERRVGEGGGSKHWPRPHGTTPMRKGVPLPPSEAAAVFVFRYLLVYSAFLASFAHGANDTANATSAFAAIWNAFDDGM